MRIALGIPVVTPDWTVNVQTMCDMTVQAARDGAVLILSSETAVTGFVNTGDPAHDMALGQPVPGPATQALGQIAQSCCIWIGVGLFEHHEGLLYDAYVVLAPSVTIETTYRRIDNHWHHWFNYPCDPMIYAEGETITSSSLPIGKTTFLLCGDLFNDTGLDQVKQMHPDWLVVPMARGFDSEVLTKEQWYNQDRYYYIERSKAAQVNLLLINQLAGWNPEASYFGGAMAVTKQGVIIKEHPLEEEGILYIDIE